MSGLVLGSSISIPSRRKRRRALISPGIIIRSQVKFVNSDEGKRLVSEEGYKILDVRDKTQHLRAHIPTSSHVPYFIENEDSDIGTLFRRTMHNNFAGLLFGIPFTKLNPQFETSVKSMFPNDDAKLLVVCQEGLRSTAAANKLVKEGCKNVTCMTSGLQSIKPGTFESVGPSELQNAGKAGLQAAQGKISAVLGAVLISALIFVTFFPDQAEYILNFIPTPPS